MTPSARLTTSYIVCLTCVSLHLVLHMSASNILHLSSFGTYYILHLSNLTSYIFLPQYILQAMSYVFTRQYYTTVLVWAQQHGVDLTSCQCRVDVLHLTSYILPMQTSYINILQWYWAPWISSASAVMELFHSVLLILHRLITCTIVYDQNLWEKKMHLLQSVKESCSKHPNGQAAPAEASSVGETSSSQKMVLTSRRNIALMTGRHAEHWSSQPQQQTQKCKHCQTSPCRLGVALDIVQFEEQLRIE